LESSTQLEISRDSILVLMSAIAISISLEIGEQTLDNQPLYLKEIKKILTISNLIIFHYNL
jgi:hypothetical protein